jgi:phosphoribosylformylglycinamidine synthase II
MSESQERMCAIVEPRNINRFLAICKKWDVTATVIGEVTQSDRLRIFWHDDVIVEVPPRTVAHEGPVYTRPIEKPRYVEELKAKNISLPIPRTDAEIKAAVLKMVSTPNIADKSWVTSQYDNYVQGNTILSQPEDSGLIRIDEKTHLGVAVSTDANARWSYLDPYEGAKLALAESCRNIATTGAKPLAVTNCLNFGSPEDPGVMWQFAESVRGLADACLELGLPVTGGNVSFYNQTGDVAILPTPIIGTLGVISDVRTRTQQGFARAGLDIYLVGRREITLAGSEWAYLHGERGGQVPKADLAHEGRLIEFLLSGQKIFSAAHDLSLGGLIASLTEMSLRNKIGVEISLDNPGEELLSETPGRVLIAIDPTDSEKLRELSESKKVEICKIGSTGGSSLKVNSVEIPLDELSSAYTEVFKKLFG